jgi:hypothetical protein
MAYANGTKSPDAAGPGIGQASLAVSRPRNVVRGRRGQSDKETAPRREKGERRAREGFDERARNTKRPRVAVIVR